MMQMAKPRKTEKEPELYRIYKTNVDTILTKNIFTTYLPISASIYMTDKGMKNPYLRVNKNGLAITHEKFEKLMGVKHSDLSDISWNSESRRREFKKSVRAPGIDMMPVLNGKDVIELEVKLTVVPTHAKNKLTEMIVRQNTQFNLTERLCYDYGDLFEDNVDLKQLKDFVEKNWKFQKPFIVHGLWKTKGSSPIFDEKNTLDVLLISDFAYLYMLLNSPLNKKLGKTMAKTRIGRVVDQILEWINEYKNDNKLTYKGPSEGSKDHLKITLYPVDYKPELKKIFTNLRLSLKDLLNIVPRVSIDSLDPERRLDTSLLFVELQKGEN